MIRDGVTENKFLSQEMDLQFYLDAVGVIAEGAIEDLGELWSWLFLRHFSTLLLGHLRFVKLS